jgi:aminopeptidase N
LDIRAITSFVNDKMVERVLLNNPFEPKLYNLSLEPDLVRFSFDGNVEIAGTITSATTKLVLHSKELLIPSASFKSGDKEISASQINFNIKETTVEFIFPEAIQPGEGTLSVPFVGTLNNQMAGFYRSSYIDANGVKKIMASTQFEPLDARRSFPCIDEPAVKVWM